MRGGINSDRCLHIPNVFYLFPCLKFGVANILYFDTLWIDHYILHMLSAYRLQRVAQENKFDKSFGFDQYISGPTKLGWLMNFSATVKGDAEGTEHSALDLFFLQEDGETFKATYQYQPYFYVAVKGDRHKEVGVFLKRRFDKQLVSAQVVELEDMDLPNHLSGIKQAYLKLAFRNCVDLMDVRKHLRSAAEANQKLAQTTEAYATFGRSSEGADCMDMIIELREYDVPYHIRVCIDKDFRVGAWYNVTAEAGSLQVLLPLAALRALAFLRE